MITRAHKLTRQSAVHISLDPIRTEGIVMKTSSFVVVALVACFAVPLTASTTACSSHGDDVAEQQAAIVPAPAVEGAETPVDEDGIIDLGCPPAPTSCPVEGPLAEAVTTEEAANPIRFMAETDKDFLKQCVTKLKGAKEATAKGIKICFHTVAMCAALVGNANGTEIEKFCEAAAKLTTCKSKAEEERDKIQNEVCKTKCSKTVACADAGASK
ncbi:MAG: hypothetical protein JST00_29820 [Deltaproteobacteria bacterium]|nr:hypothetical protein [Deltaproteobacteria bacterium]